MKENFGNLEDLEQLGKNKKNNYTVEQLLDENLKNEDGESNQEVRKRMLECINEILEKDIGKRIAIVSHGAAIKYFIQNWCEYNYEEDYFYFQGEKVCERTLGAPSVLKLVFNNQDLISIKKYEI